MTDHQILSVATMSTGADRNLQTALIRSLVHVERGQRARLVRRGTVLGIVLTDIEGAATAESASRDRP